MARRRFQPRLWPTLGLLLSFAVLGSLGTWQVFRYFEKEELQRRQQARMERPPVAFTELVDKGSADVTYRHVTAAGRLDHRRVFLWKRRFYKGDIGHHLIVPLEVEGLEKRLLVNRGWLHFKNVGEKVAALPEQGRVEVSGILAPTRHTGAPASPQDEPLPDKEGSQDQVIIEHLNFEDIQSRLPYPVYENVLWQEPPSEEQPRSQEERRSAESPIPTYEGVIISRELPPWRHAGYAATWYSLLLVAVAFYVVSQRRRVDP